MSLNDFEIIHELGFGAFSQVYKVKRRSDSQIYALKQVQLTHLSPRDRENSLNEVRILASISHKNVISYRDSFLDQPSNSLCIVMEIADCGDLSQRIRELARCGGRFAEAEIWNISAQLARGLSAIHELSILHRDLKSANVFLTSDGQAKIGDLNVSKQAKNGLLVTQTGTPYYASPEVWSDRPYGLKSDIWSLGCVMYEMAALRPPFKAGNMAGLYQQVMRGKVSPLPSVYSSSLASIIKSMLQINPHSRPSCRKLLVQMENMGKIDPQTPATTGDSLLKSIHFPKHWGGVNSQLPSPRYSPTTHKRNMKKLSIDQCDRGSTDRLSLRTRSLQRIEDAICKDTPKLGLVSKLPKIFRMPPPKVFA